jgi:hypothetical protein
LGGWNLYRYYSAKIGLKMKLMTIVLQKKPIFQLVFLVFFIVTVNYVWDWIMSIDPHWFSTLFGWYVSSFFVSGITVIALVTVFLKSKGI